MTNKEWLELIEKKEEEIIETGIKAYEDALNNKHLRFIVEMDEDGEVYSWYDIAGGNSFHSTAFNGTAIELFQFCFQYYDVEITEEMIVDKLNEKGYGNRIEELKAEAEEEYTSLESVINNNHEELFEVIEECQKEVIEFEISEYAREGSEQKLEYIKEQLKIYID